MALSESYFYNAAVYYLQRYAAPAAQLRRILQRKVLRASHRGEEIPAAAPQWIEKAVEKCIAMGFVNDRVFAEQKARSLHRQGRARNVIATTLQQLGVDRELVGEILHEVLDADENVAPGDSELAAARRTVQRKRLGRDPDPEARRKDLAKLLRGGFSMSIARRALESAGDEEAD